MFNDYVMVAADIPHMDGTEQDAEYRYGDLVQTSLGTGMVVDLCGMAERVRKGQLAGTQDADVGVWYDIYTAWHDGGEYERKAYHPETTPTETTKSSKPTTPTEPTKPTETTKSSKPTTPTEPTKSSKPTTSTEPTKSSKPTTSTEPAKSSKPTTLTKPTKLTKPTTPTEPTKPTTPTEPTKPTTPTKPTKPTKPTTPTKPSIPSVTEPENTETPVIKCTPEAVLKAAQNIESKENCSSYVCDILHSSGYFTEEEMNMYKDTNISEICEELAKRDWNKITDLTNLKNGDIIIVNNGETVRIYAGNNSWYTVGNSELQQGNENWTDNISWEAYRPGKII